MLNGEQIGMYVFESVTCGTLFLIYKWKIVMFSHEFWNINSVYYTHSLLVLYDMVFTCSRQKCDYILVVAIPVALCSLVF